MAEGEEGQDLCAGAAAPAAGRKRPKPNPLAGKIKRLMQADEDVGKIAQATPGMIGCALERFIAQLVQAAAARTAQDGGRTILPGHIKLVAGEHATFDFLKDVDCVAGAADPPPPPEKKAAARRRKPKPAAGEASDSEGAPDSPPARKRQRKPRTKAASAAAADESMSCPHLHIIQPKIEGAPAAGETGAEMEGAEAGDDAIDHGGKAGRDGDGASSGDGGGVHDESDSDFDVRAEAGGAPGRSKGKPKGKSRPRRRQAASAHELPAVPAMVSDPDVAQSNENPAQSTPEGTQLILISEATAPIAKTAFAGGSLGASEGGKPATVSPDEQQQTGPPSQAPDAQADALADEASLVTTNGAVLGHASKAPTGLPLTTLHPPFSIQAGPAPEEDDYDE